MIKIGDYLNIYIKYTVCSLKLSFWRYGADGLLTKVYVSKLTTNIDNEISLIKTSRFLSTNKRIIYASTDTR